MSMVQKRLVVIGGGAAGFFGAVNAARQCAGLEVIVLEKSSKVLSKVRVSGGGRCNVTHACYEVSAMLKKYPRGAAFLKKAFNHFFTTDTIKWFEERGVPLKTEVDGRMFPESNSSESIVECLLRETNRYGVQIWMNREVTGIRQSGAAFELQVNGVEFMTTDYLLIACGGYSKAAQFEWLKSTGHTFETPAPSLFTFNMPDNDIRSLMGVSVTPAQVKINALKLQEKGPVLITHWGMSGPAVLRLSAWGARALQEQQYVFSIMVNWLPAFNEQTLKAVFQQKRFELAAQLVHNRNPFGLPQRLWQFLATESGVPDTMRWADLPAKEQNKFIKQLCVHEMGVKGKTTFKEEFVTCGGINLGEVDANTMMSKLVAQLYFAGEVMDVDGVTGGFNFQHAWTSGFIAAKSISEDYQIMKTSGSIIP